MEEWFDLSRSNRTMNRNDEDIVAHNEILHLIYISLTQTVIIIYSYTAIVDGVY